jgi:hypothetical protein
MPDNSFKEFVPGKLGALPEWRAAVPFALDKNRTPGKLVFDWTITFKETWHKETHTKVIPTDED